MYLWEDGMAAASARKGTGDKHQAIIRGALAVFAKAGYTRASIDAIAAEAGVSTRTIYNHFEDKARLFQTAIHESATRVAEAQIALIERHLTKVTDLEQDLLEFGRAWAMPMTDYTDHFAMVRQINAEVGHIPAAALETWQDTGPRRVRRELAAHFQRLADRGLLRIDDPDRAAMHFALLTAAESTSRSFHGVIPIPGDEVIELADSGVHAFLNGYRA
jgi:AcrR family transcriptional regulator